MLCNKVHLVYFEEALSFLAVNVSSCKALEKAAYRAACIFNIDREDAHYLLLFCNVITAHNFQSVLQNIERDIII